MKTKLISLVSKPMDENKVNFIGVKTLGLKHGPKAEPHTGCCIFHFAVFFVIDQHQKLSGEILPSVPGVP